MSVQSDSGEHSLNGHFPPPSGFPPPDGNPVGSVEYARAAYQSGYRRAALMPNPRTTPIGRPLLAVSAVALIGAVLLYPYGLRSVAVAVAIAGLFAVSVASLQTHRDAQIVAVVAAVAFLPWLFIRASPWLLSLDLIAFFAVAVQVFSRRGSILRRSVAGYIAQWADGLLYGFAGPSYYVAAVADGGRGTERAVRAVKVAGIPVLVFLIVIGLLAAGDQLFASYFSFLRLDTLVARLFLALAAVLVFMGAVGAASRPAHDDAAAKKNRWSLPAAPTLWTLVGLAVALTAYAAVQLSAAAYGADYVTERTGLTFAEWARRGFLAMSVVAVIASLALGASSIAVARHGQRRRLAQLAATVVTLGVIGVAASSIIKLSVYSDQYGLTMLRVYSLTFTGWMALVTVIQLVSIWRPGGGWVTSAVLVSAMVGVFAMNIANPELIVMRHNLDRAESVQLAPDLDSCDSLRCSEGFDSSYALRLSEDAYPELLSRLDVLSTGQRTTVLDVLCRGRGRWTTGLNYNRALNETKGALRSACG